MEPGEIYYVDLIGAGIRPGIVVSRESLNRGNYVVVVLCTSTRFAQRSQLPNCVPFHAGEFGLAKDCVAQCESVLYVDKSRIDIAQGIIGILDDGAWRKIVKALGHVFDSDCEPN